MEKYFYNVRFGLIEQSFTPYPQYFSESFGNISMIMCVDESVKESKTESNWGKRSCIKFQNNMKYKINPTAALSVLAETMFGKPI